MTADRRKRVEEIAENTWAKWEVTMGMDFDTCFIDAMLAFADECAAEIQKELDAMRVLAAAPQATQILRQRQRL